MLMPSIDPPFSPTIFDDLSLEGSIENPIVLDKEEDKETSPPPALSTLEPVRPTEPPRLLISRTFRARKKIVLDFVHRKLFQK